MWINLDHIKPTTIRELWEDMRETLSWGERPGVVLEEIRYNIRALEDQYYSLIGVSIEEADHD